MAAAGLAVRVDAVGNLIGRRRADPAAGRCCSARTSTRCATPAATTARSACWSRSRAPSGCARRPRCRSRSRSSAFADEEGPRYGTAYLGSRAVAGALRPRVAGARDADGVAMADALRDVRRRPAASPAPRGATTAARLRRGAHRAGAGARGARRAGRRRRRASPGQTRAGVDFTGRAGHAGTVPMDVRRDALRARRRSGSRGRGRGARTSRGSWRRSARPRARPARRNVIPGAAVALARRPPCRRRGARGGGGGAARTRRGGSARARGVEVAWERASWPRPPWPATPALDGALAAAVAERGLPVVTLASGAGHDAVALAAVTASRCSSCAAPAGVSHHPAESRRRAPTSPSRSTCSTRFVCAPGRGERRRPADPRRRRATSRSSDGRIAARRAGARGPGARGDRRARPAPPPRRRRRARPPQRPGPRRLGGLRHRHRGAGGGRHDVRLDMPLNAHPPTIDGAAFDAKLAAAAGSRASTSRCGAGSCPATSTTSTSSPRAASSASRRSCRPAASTTSRPPTT